MTILEAIELRLYRYELEAAQNVAIRVDIAKKMAREILGLIIENLEQTKVEHQDAFK